MDIDRRFSNSISRLTTLWLLLIILGCNQLNSDETMPVVFHYNQHNNITSLDPAYAKSQNNIWAVNHIFSTLVRLNDSLEIVPDLADSWTVSQDGLIYTFGLKSNVFFHSDPCFEENSRVFTAHDAVFSFDRLQDTLLNAPGSWIFKNRVAEEEPFVAINDTTLQIRLKAPFAPFLSLLTMQYCSIVAHEAIASYGSNSHRHPVGTGPFKFKKWLDNQGLFLERNLDYYGWEFYPGNNLQGIRTSFIGERSLAFLELVNRRIDFFSGLESSYIYTSLEPDGTLKERYKERIQFLKAPYLNFEYFGFNQYAENAHPLLKEANFRRALNFGIDRNLMLQSLRNGVGKPANSGVITKGLPSFDPELVKGYQFDIHKAHSLLQEFSEDQLQLPLIIHTSKDYLDLTTYIAKQWEDLGLSVQIEVMESATLRNAMREGTIGLFRASWIADYPDGESFLSMFYSKNPAPPNYTRYRNDQFDRLYEAGLLATSSQQKIELYQEMDRLLIEDAPVVFLFYDEVALFANKAVKGLSLNALNLLHAQNISKSE